METVKDFFNATFPKIFFKLGIFTEYEFASIQVNYNKKGV